LICKPIKYIELYNENFDVYVRYIYIYIYIYIGGTLYIHNRSPLQAAFY